MVPSHLYEYVLVQTSMYFVPQVRKKYVLFSLSAYLVHTGMYCAYKHIAGDDFCVVCLWETILCVRDMYVVVLQH